MEGMRVKESLLEFIGLYKDTFICHWQVPDSDYRQPSRKKFGHYKPAKDGSIDYYIISKVFIEEVVKPLNATENVIARMLEAEGLLIKELKGKFVMHKTFKGATNSCYHFRVPKDL